MSGTAIYIGDFKLGVQDAQSQLVWGNCEILRELGYRAILIGNDNSLAQGRILRDTKMEMFGYDVYNIMFSKGLGDLSGMAGVHREIVAIAREVADLKLVICYGAPTFSVELGRLAVWCRKHGVAFVANCVDLPCQAHGSTLERCIKTLDRKWRERIFMRKTDGILAVSRYIARHYEKEGRMLVAIIPPLKDAIRILPPCVEERAYIQMVYVGIPFPVDGRKVDEKAYKERIDRFIEMLCDVRRETPPFCFDIYGLTKAQYLGVVKAQEVLLEENGDIIRFHGRVTHDEAVEAVRRADYSVLYRDVNEMTMAGFSSKLVESISCGTPMILTDTSDYMRYLQDGIHCHLLDVNDDAGARRKLADVLKGGKSEIPAMKDACYQSRMFDYRNFTGAMKEFVETVLAKKDDEARPHKRDALAPGA